MLDRLRLTAANGATLAALASHQGRQELVLRRRPEALEALRTVALVESSESSNRLEGIAVPRARVEGLVLKAAEMRNRSEQEVAGYRDALVLIHKTRQRCPWSRGFCCSCISSSRVTAPAGVGCGRAPTTKSRSAMPVAGWCGCDFAVLNAVAVPQAMDLLMAEIRTALDRSGWVLGRYISLERLVEEARAGYYESLEASSQGWHEQQHDPLPWCRFLWGVLLRGYSGV